MIQLLLLLRVPAECVRDAEQVLRAQMISVQCEPGCTGAGLYSEAGRPDRLRYVEEWQDADLAARIQSLGFARLVAIMETVAEAPRLEFRFVSEVRGIDYAEELRAATSANAFGAPLTTG
jgi:quinol monooxygenase YgiN